MTALLDPSDPLVRDVEPSVRLAIAAELSKHRTFVELDGEVLDVERFHEFQGREAWGGHSSPPEVRAVRERAWFTAVRASKAREATVRQTERRRLQRVNLAALLEQTATLAARQARRDALVELVAPADIEAAETELPSTDLVSPLGERGPPCVRATASDSGHGLSVALGKVPAMTGSKIVPTGRSGGDG